MARKKAPSPPNPPYRPAHEPTDLDRNTVSVMIAAGIAQADVARCRGISAVTLRKHYKHEIATGTTAINTLVVIEHIKRIKAGDFQAIKWWEQSRMGWREHVVVDDSRLQDVPLRVIIELVGDPAPAHEGAASLSASPVHGTPRPGGNYVQLVG